MSTVTPDPTVVAVIARLKAAVALAEAWTQGDVALDVVGTAGTYPSLAKLMKSTQDQINALLTNPTLLGTGGFTPPKGTTAQREAAAAKGRVRYNTTLDTIEILTANGWLSLQNLVISTYRGSVVPSTGTTRIPYDTTPPAVTEGTQLWSVTVAPKVIGSIMSIDFATMVDNSNNGNLSMAIFKGNTLIGVTGINIAGNKAAGMAISVNDPVTSLTPVTYSCRFGNTAGTWYQGRGSTTTYGGAITNGWKIDEVLP
jgi:hypothetical protein